MSLSLDSVGMLIKPSLDANFSLSLFIYSIFQILLSLHVRVCVCLCV